MKNWLIKNKDRLSIRGIEKEIGCPDTTLQKVVQGKQGLPKKWEEPLQKVIEDMKY